MCVLIHFGSEWIRSPIWETGCRYTQRQTKEKKKIDGEEKGRIELIAQRKKRNKG